MATRARGSRWNTTDAPRYHEEVVGALREIGNRRLGVALARSRGSELEYFGVRTPPLRRAVKAGFSFYQLTDEQILEVWDDLWRHSPYGEVLFAALEYYAPMTRRRVNPDLWPVMRHWSGRLENWAHCDGLGGLYSRILEAYPDEVYPQIETWNAAESEWLRRISIVSLIHYSGKNAVFMPLDKVLPLLSNCLEDDRHYVQKAVGWVLREMGHVYPGEIRSYLEEHAASLSTIAFSRAIERRVAAEKAELRQLREDSLA